jgi:hypothetical protein
MASFDFIEAPYRGKCDFCSASEVGAWCFLTGAVQVGLEGDVGIPVDGAPEGKLYKKVIMSDDGHWNACDACRQFIEAKDGDGLARRSSDAMGLSYTAVRMTQELMFWATFEGHSHPSRVHLEEIQKRREVKQ